MNDTLVLPRRARIDRTDRWLAAVAVVVFAAVVGIFIPVLATPATVDRVTIRNSDTWSVNVSISGSDPDDWLPLGAATPGDTSVPDVIDPGAEWLVRFTSGELVYTEHMSRASIAANRWTILVPSQIEDQIRSSGADAPPTS